MPSGGRCAHETTLCDGLLGAVNIVPIGVQVRHLGNDATFGARLTTGSDRTLLGEKGITTGSKDATSGE